MKAGMEIPQTHGTAAPVSSASGAGQWIRPGTRLDGMYRERDIEERRRVKPENWRVPEEARLVREPETQNDTNPNTAVRSPEHQEQGGDGHVYGGGRARDDSARRALDTPNDLMHFEEMEVQAGRQPEMNGAGVGALLSPLEALCRNVTDLWDRHARLWVINLDYYAISETDRCG